MHRSAKSLNKINTQQTILYSEFYSIFRAIMIFEKLRFYDQKKGNLQF